jgi:hypothetical protein
MTWEVEIVFEQRNYYDLWNEHTSDAHELK